MHALLLPVGSHGDVLPLVGIGAALAARGHAVTLVTAEPFRPLADRHGFGFVPTGTAADYDAVIHDPDLWHPTKSLHVLFGGERPERMLRAAYAAIAGRFDPARPREVVVVSGSLGLAGRIARDKLGVPLATVHLQPMALPSVADPPELATLRIRRWWPHWYRRLLYWAGERLMLDPLLSPAVNGLRRELGLPAVKRIFGPWRHSPDRLLLAFPDWYASAPDWPAHARHVGFIRYDQADVVPTPPAVEAFLASGPPPVVVSFGSAMRQAGPYLAAAVRALERTGRRGLILAKAGAQIPPALPALILQADYAPFGAVFPRAAAVIHHGGIGTSAQALAAGVPQLVMPMAFDQADNAARLARLGVATSLTPARFTPDAVAAALQELTGTAGACQQVRTRTVAESDGAAAAAGWVEALARTG